jgi:hypothetical protein
MGLHRQVLQLPRRWQRSARAEKKKKKHICFSFTSSFDSERRAGAAPPLAMAPTALMAFVAPLRNLFGPSAGGSWRRSESVHYKKKKGEQPCPAGGRWAAAPLPLPTCSTRAVSTRALSQAVGLLLRWWRWWEGCGRGRDGKVGSERKVVQGGGASTCRQFHAPIPLRLASCRVKEVPLACALGNLLLPPRRQRLLASGRGGRRCRFWRRRCGRGRSRARHCAGGLVPQRLPSGPARARAWVG